MSLKTIVDELLKEKNRPMSWLAEEMNKTFDGLKLSLIKGSIKYNDIIEMARILEVAPAFFFGKENSGYDAVKGWKQVPLSEPKENYIAAKTSLRDQREVIALLKEQIKDKDMIISLLTKKN